MLAAHLRPDQEAAHPHHPGTMRRALLGGPPDPQLPGAQGQRRRRKSRRTHPPVLRADQIAQLAARMGHRPSRMFPAHQLRPDPPPFPIPHRHQFQRPHRIHPCRNPHRRRYRGPQTTRGPIPRRRPSRHPPDPEHPLQPAQFHQATRRAELAAGIHQAEFPTDPTSHRRPSGKRSRGQQRSEALQTGGRLQRGADRYRRVHTARMPNAA